MSGKVLQVSAQNPRTVLITVIIVELRSQSTLLTDNVINALLGSDVKPAGVTAVTNCCCECASILREVFETDCLDK